VSQVTGELLPRLKEGDVVSASHLNRLVDAVNELTARSERDSELRLKLPETTVSDSDGEGPDLPGEV
jgi:hypothetical protein